MPLRSQVTIRTLNRGQENHVWFAFDSDHESLFDLNEHLAEDGTLYGIRIETEHAGPGQRVETKRYECVIGADVIVTITPLQFELIESASVERVA